MKIEFTETGGLMGRTKTAVIDYSIDDDDWKELINTLRADPDSTSTLRDGFNYTLKKFGFGTEIPISISKIPSKWNDLFDELYKNLKYD